MIHYFNYYYLLIIDILSLAKQVATSSSLINGLGFIFGWKV